MVHALGRVISGEIITVKQRLVDQSRQPAGDEVTLTNEPTKT
ncbi:MAG: hypothetical protein ACXU98_07860 [Syntrophales bacterium]